MIKNNIPKNLTPVLVCDNDWVRGIFIQVSAGESKNGKMQYYKTAYEIVECDEWYNLFTKEYSEDFPIDRIPDIFK